ncbi:MAG: pilus assembly protein [Legionellales bacterium]|nr:pilus assembly protein [Legionellales bacterium]
MNAVSGMRHPLKTIKRAVIILMMLIGLSFTWTPAKGGELDLATTPLFLGSTVKPNIFFMVDDSGSMDWSILTPVHWHACSYDPNITGSYYSSECGFEITNGMMRTWANNNWRYIAYMYRTSDNDYPDDCNSTSYASNEACGAEDSDWRVLSSDLNVIYYNPDSTHSPWNGPCVDTDELCTNASFSNARSNPREGTQGYSSTRNLAGFEYAVWIDDRGYSDSRPLRGSNVNATDSSNDEIDLWDSHVKFVVDSTNVQVWHITYNPNSSGMNATETLKTTLSGSACYNVLGGKSSVRTIAGNDSGWSGTGSGDCRTISEVQQNVADWYTYERRRSFVTKSAISSVIKDAEYYRYGLSVINLYTSLFTEVPSDNQSEYAEHNNALLADLYDFNWPVAGTPLRSGLQKVGQYFDNTLSGKSDPIQEACQQNFSILLTDGYWNGDSPSSYIGDSDNDGHSRTLADVAHYYYDKDLSDLENIVAPNTFDEATHQHMVTFTVAFGVSGLLIDTDNDGWPDPTLDTNDDWGNPFYSEASKIDDLWHAAYNSSGTFVGAQTPDSVSETLAAALANIANRVSSATTVAQNSTTLKTDSQVYQARFDSSNWSGQLLAYTIDSEGEIGSTPVWNAHCVLTGGTCTAPSSTFDGISYDNRVIITRDWTSASGIPFRTPEDFSVLLEQDGTLPDNLDSLLANAPYEISTSNTSEQNDNWDFAEDLIEYIRGNRDHESQNSPSVNSFRNRGSILGDIIHSDPVYVGAPQRLYNDNFDSAPYSAFKSAYASRMPVVYTGGNDGMMHGFRADTGAEVIAYVPGIRHNYEKLPNLAVQPYLHQYLVDGSPTVSDVVIGNEWRTVLASGMRSGGQGIFALDVTDPSSFSEANAENIYLFEFSDEDDADLGFTHSNITLAKVKVNAADYRWAAIFGNGYNNSQADGYASSNGQASLFIVLLEGGTNGQWTLGSNYFKLSTGVGSTSTPNGLASPYAVDINADYITDYVYAGDLEGNMWRFDLTGSASEWNSSKLFETDNNQAITASPIVGVHPTGLENGVLVYFGTGKYLEPTDNSTVSQTTQSFYAVWDQFDGSTISKADLLEQEILDEQAQLFDTDGDAQQDSLINGRRTTDDTIDWDVNNGWYMDLIVSGSNDNQGERQVTRPLLRNGAVIFTTLIPSSSSCDFGGESWIMELDAASGSALPMSPFDFNNNHTFDDGDKIDFVYGQTAERAAASGYQSEVGITATPAVFVAASKVSEVKVISGSGGLGSFTEGPVNTTVGRQTWRQIK